MDPVITGSICIGMSLLFAVAAAHKLRAPAAFRSAMDQYRLLPPRVSGSAAAFFVAAELTAALLVLIPAARAAGLRDAAPGLALPTATDPLARGPAAFGAPVGANLIFIERARRLDVRQVGYFPTRTNGQQEWVRRMTAFGIHGGSSVANLLSVA